jgi:hypothetical protein
MIRRAFALVLAVSALWLGSFDAASALPAMRPLIGLSHQVLPSITPAAQDRAMSCYERCRRQQRSADECNRRCGE